MATKRSPLLSDGHVNGVRQTLAPHPFSIAVSTAARPAPFPEPVTTDKAYRDLVRIKRHLERELKYANALLQRMERQARPSGPVAARVHGKEPGRSLQ